MTLRETGVDKLTNRLNVFLTNTLEEGVPQQPDLFSFGLAEAVSEESRLAAEVKSEKPVMVVMGNPPYSVSSNNKSKWIQNLITDYKKDLNERKINLDDDYIKFIRFADDLIARNGSGIVAMITNNSYIDGITHRQMRKHLLQTFDKIYVLDLHGNSKKKEVAPDGSVDENVFDIMQGVSIVLMIKNNHPAARTSDVLHDELWGSREQKFDSLSEDAITYKKVSFNAPRYYFVPKDTRLIEAYESGISVNQLFINKSSGFRSGAADSQICFEKDDIIRVVNDLIELPETDFRTKYNLVDGRNHNYVGMRKDVGDAVDPERVIQTAWHSPFDIRWTYYSYISSGFAARPRNQTMNNFVNKTNIGLMYMRGHIEPQGAAAGVTSLVSSERTFSRPGMSSADSVAPLYVYHPDGTRKPNFDPAEISALTRELTKPYEPEDIFDYIYAVLHSPSYREKYKEFLKIDFPRVPVPTQSEFDRLVPLGRELRQLHLMKSPVIDDYPTSFPVSGDNVVEKLRYEFDESSQFTSADSNGKVLQQGKLGRVYINATQYFGGVPDIAWNFYIGGYQPAQKWLKDRKGRELSDDDLVHYQRIIKVLLETDRTMKNIG